MALKKASYIGLVMIIAVSLESCGVVKSTQGDMSVAHTNDALMYFLPTGRVDVRVIVDDQGNTKIIPATLYLPDVTRPYYFRYTESWMSSDQVNIKLTKYGLLSEVTSSSQDATPQIIGKLSEAAAKVLQFLAVPIAGGGPLPPPKIVFDSDIVVDPTVTTDRERLNEWLGPLGISVYVEPEDGYPAKSLAAPKAQEGIYYRPLIPYQLTFTSGEKRTGRDLSFLHYPPYGIRSVTIYLPNEAPILAIDVLRKPFVKNTVKLEFDNGVLESVAYDKPSEALGLAAIPADLAKTLLSTASNVFVFRYQDMNTDQQLLGVQKKLGDTQNELIQTQQKLIDSQRSSMEAAQLAKQKQDAANTPDGSSMVQPSTSEPATPSAQCKPDAHGNVPPACPGS